MAGGLLQIMGYGVQDIMLTHNPQITFFKIVYKRHTNFSVETVEQTFLNGADFGKKSSITLNNHGDLLTKMYLRVVVSKIELKEDEMFAWVKRLGYALIDRVEFEVGGVNIDRQYGIWLDIWHELARSSDHDNGFNKIIGDVSAMTRYNNRDKPEYILFIPLKFWFNRHYGLAVPLIGIQYHDVKVHVRFNKLDNLMVYNGVFKAGLDEKKIKLKDVSLLTDYVYLDKEERSRFAVSGHEYLIEQVQFTGEDIVNPDSASKRVQLQFEYPVKELQWCLINGNYVNSKKFLCYTDEDDWDDAIYECSRQLLRDSLIIGTYEPCMNGVWECVGSEQEGVTSNGNIKIVNCSKEDLCINTESLKIGDYSLTDKIKAVIVVMSNCEVIIKDLCTGITVRDVSFPINKMIDNRARCDNDVFVNQFSNYGELINGSINPVKSAKLDYNDFERFERRDGRFFNYVQPEMHHSNTPKDGVNSYSFGFNPEWHQPSGSSNMSVVDNIFMTVWFKEDKKSMRDRTKSEAPSLEVVNSDSRFYVFAFNYNIFRVMNGLSAVAY